MKKTVIAALTALALPATALDMMPEPGLLSSYMAYLHVTDWALLVGHRRFVCVDALSDAQVILTRAEATASFKIVRNACSKCHRAYRN